MLSLVMHAYYNHVKNLNTQQIKCKFNTYMKVVYESYVNLVCNGEHRRLSKKSISNIKVATIKIIICYDIQTLQGLL